MIRSVGIDDVEEFQGIAFCFERSDWHKIFLWLVNQEISAMVAHCDDQATVLMFDDDEDAILFKFAFSEMSRQIDGSEKLTILGREIWFE